MRAAVAGQTAAPQTVVTLTLDEALKRAEANQPAFVTAEAERRATALERKDAVAGLLPSVTYHNEYLFTQSNRSRSSTVQGGVTEALPVFIANNAVHEYASQGVVNENLGLAKLSELRLADAKSAKAEAELEVARRGLVSAVVNFYYQAQAGNEKRAVAQRALAEANRFVDITTKREEAREAAHADVIKARLAQQQRQRDSMEADLAAAKAALELGVLMFPDPSAKFELSAPPAPALLPDRSAVETVARASNPELRSALADVALGRAEMLGAQAALLPDLGLNFTYGIDAPQFAKTGPDNTRNLGYSASATLDIPVWDWMTNVRKVKEARLRSDASRVALTAAQRRLVANLQEYYDEADVASKQLASLDASVVDARESLRLTNLRYVDGESTVLDVVDAQNTLTSAENARADGVVRYQVALAQLQTLTGRF